MIVGTILRSLENKIYKYMTSVSKNIYFGKLKDILQIAIILLTRKLKRSLLMLLLIRGGIDFLLLIEKGCQRTEAFTRKVIYIQFGRRGAYC